MYTQVTKMLVNMCYNTHRFLIGNKNRNLEQKGSFVAAVHGSRQEGRCNQAIAGVHPTWPCFSKPEYRTSLCDACVLHIVYNDMFSVSWPSCLIHQTQALVLSSAKCGFESRSRHLYPWTRHYDHNCFVKGREGSAFWLITSNAPSPMTTLLRWGGNPVSVIAP